MIHQKCIIHVLYIYWAMRPCVINIVGQLVVAFRHSNLFWGVLALQILLAINWDVEKAEKILRTSKKVISIYLFPFENNLCDGRYDSSFRLSILAKFNKFWTFLEVIIERPQVCLLFEKSWELLVRCFGGQKLTRWEMSAENWWILFTFLTGAMLSGEITYVESKEFPSELLKILAAIVW